MTPKIRLVVIGGGPAGIAVLKAFLRNSKPELGIEAVLIESQGHLGGSFVRYGYEGGMMNSSNALTAFSDLPLSEDTADHISFDDYVKYLRRYCEKFELGQHIKLRTKVERVERLSGGQWAHRVYYRSEAEDGPESLDCSHIAVCTGLQAIPSLPHIPGIEHFPGEVYHSSDYKGPSQLVGRDVLFLGGGESACEISKAAAIHAKSKMVSCRGGTVSMEKQVNVLGHELPLDWVFTSSFRPGYMFQGPLWRKMGDAVLQWLMWMTQGTRGAELPVHRWREAYVTRSGAGQSLLDTESICTFPSTISPTGDITFTDDPNRTDDGYGRVYRASTIIHCTGYQPAPSVFPDCYPSLSEATCRHIVSPEDPTVAYFNFVRPRLGASGPIAEISSWWYLHFVQGDMKSLPTSQPHYTLRARQEGRFDPGVHFSDYLVALAMDIGCYPDLRTLLGCGLWVTAAFILGPSRPGFFRLKGPFQDPMMAGLIAREFQETVKQKGWLVLLGLVPLMSSCL